MWPRGVGELGDLVLNQAFSDGVVLPKTTAQLRAPNGYNGIYANWKVDIGTIVGNQPWYFDAFDPAYPRLKADHNRNGVAAFGEFGSQASGVGDLPGLPAPRFDFDARILDIYGTVGYDAWVRSNPLPKANNFGEDEVTYSVTPNVSQWGLTFDPETRELSGAFSKRLAEREFTYKATDTNGSDTLKFTMIASDVVPGRGVTVSPQRITLIEDQVLDPWFSFVLDAEPSGPVYIRWSAVSSIKYHIFTPDNWDTPRTEGGNQWRDSSANLRHYLRAYGGGYDGIVIPQVYMTLVEKDEPENLLYLDEGVLTEGDSGQSAMTFRARLLKAHTQEVTFDWATEDDTATAPGDYKSRSGSGTIPVGERFAEFSVPIVGDTIAEEMEFFTVQLSNPTGTGFARWGDDASGNIIDNDTGIGLTLSEDILRITEGGTDTYTVKLNAKPSEDVTLTIANTNPEKISVSESSLTFTTSNWNTAQQLTVTAEPDNDDENDHTSLYHVASGSGHDGVTIGEMPVATKDNNVGPTFTGGFRIGLDYEENATTPVYTVEAEDADQQDAGSVTLTLLDAPDGVSFDYNADTLTFKSPPDYEHPTDRWGGEPLRRAGRQQVHRASAGDLRHGRAAAVIHPGHHGARAGRGGRHQRGLRYR